MGMFEDMQVMMDERKNQVPQGFSPVMGGTKMYENSVMNPQLGVNPDMVRLKEILELLSNAVPAKSGAGLAAAGLGGITRLQGQNIFPAASVVGQLRSMGAIGDSTARQMLQHPDPELYNLVVQELLNKQKLMPR